MSNDIINQNADLQDSELQRNTAIKKLPVENNMDDQITNSTVEETEISEMPQNGLEAEITTKSAESSTSEIKSQTPVSKAHEEPTPSTAHDDFDWSVDKRNVTSYNKEERIKYDEVYDKTFKQINDNEMVLGTVVGMTKTDVVINIGFKSDGLVGLNEFRDMPNLKVGDEVEVMVAEKEDKDGNLHLSRKQARTTRAWERIVDMHKTGEIVKGLVTSKTKGGLIVDVLGMETFLPGSQIDVKPVTDYDQFVGKTMEFKVVKINEA
ncbi:MAG: S1 RNA-binding domain-containing protein, partial [Ginsengibacter sp.]